MAAKAAGRKELRLNVGRMTLTIWGIRWRFEKADSLPIGVFSLPSHALFRRRTTWHGTTEERLPERRQTGRGRTMEGRLLTIHTSLAIQGKPVNHLMTRYPARLAVV